jgi:superfamily II DNA or RNA helicase
MFPKLRPFQESALQSVRDGFKAGHKNQIVMCPTGGGKTILAMALIKSCLEKGKRAVFLADRKTLINQSSFVADSLGLKDHSVMMANHDRFDVTNRLQIASIQTVARRGWPEADLYIVDECHTLMKAWTKYIVGCKGAVIGLSATPFSNLGNYFTNLITAATMKELTQQGYLVPMRIFSCKKVDMREAETVNGEWSSAAAAERGMRIVGNVVKEWIKFGEGRKTIAFCANIAHAESLCGAFNQEGIPARIFTAYTKDKERIDILDEFKNPDSYIKVLLTVDALAKGFDNIHVSCICDVRPLRKSFSTAVQIWGRMLRCAPNKKDAILLDFSGNIIRFGADFENMYHNGLKELSDGKLLDKKIRKDPLQKEDQSCPACKYKPFKFVCMSCGHVLVKRTEIVHDIGEMHEFKIKDLTIQGKDLYDQCYSLCCKKGNILNSLQRAGYLYKSITGQFPKFNNPKIVEISEEVINRQKYNMIKYRYGIKKASL